MTAIWVNNFRWKYVFTILSDIMIAQLKWKIVSLVWIFPEQFITMTVLFFKNSSAKSLLPYPFALKEWDSYNALGASLPTAPSNFTQRNWFWKWFWKPIGKVDLNFKWAISLGKQIFIIINRKLWQKSPSLLPSRNWFSKAPQAFLMLNLSRKS